MLLLFLLFPSCQNQALRHDFRDSSWSKSDTVEFYFTPQTTADITNLDIHLRSLDGYPYSNLAVRVEVDEIMPLRRRFITRDTIRTDGRVLGSDTTTVIVRRISHLTATTQTFVMQDAHNVGHSISSISLPLHLNQATTYRMRITHRMRSHSLPFISSIWISSPDIDD